MDHGGEPARPTTTVGSAQFAYLGMAGAVQGSEANIGSGVVPVAAEFHRHHELGGGVLYPNIGASWRQLGPVGVLIVGPQLPDGALRVHGNDGYYSVLQPRPGARRGVMDHLLPDGAGHGEAFVGSLPGGGVATFDDYGYYTLQPRPGAGHGEVLVDMLHDGAGHGELFIGLLPGGGGAAFDDYGYYTLQLVDMLPDGAGHGDVFVGLLPSGGGAVHNDYAWQPRPGAERGEMLPNGVDRIGGALRGPNLGEGNDKRGVVAEHLRRLLPFAGIGASSVAINGLAAGPGSPAAAFELFVLLLGGMFLVIRHVVLRV